MKNLFLGILSVLIILLFTSSSFIQKKYLTTALSLVDDKWYGKEFFPINLTKTLTYNSTFGELVLKVTKDKNTNLFSYDSEKFKYRQKLFIDDKGLFVNETYQKLKLLLFITKEGNYVYDKPLLRVPFPVQIGQEWSWNGKEFIDGKTHTVSVKGKASKVETITTPAGKFETLKVETILETSEGSKNKLTEWYAEDFGMVKMHVSIEGGGMLGIARDILGYGNIEFELKKVSSK